MICYTIRKSTRARQLRVTIKADASVVVTVPMHVSEARATIFVKEKMGWIQDKVEIMQERAESQAMCNFPKGSRHDLEKCKDAALSLVQEKLAHFNRIYGFTWKKVHVKHVTTRWGSCSKDGNLNFSYRIAFLPPYLQDYLVVHELCHLEQMNHSPKFWKLVSLAIPEYVDARKTLKRIP